MTDEIFDIVDDNDNVIGQAARSDVHQSGLQHRGVHLLLFDREGRLLIQKRSADRSQYASMWDCSVSEHVKAGESYQEAVHRGLLEELGLTGIECQPLVHFRMLYGPNDNEISTLFRGIIDPAQVRFDSDEIEQVAYFSLDEVAKLMESGDMAFSYWFIQLLRWYGHGSSDMIILI